MSAQRGPSADAPLPSKSRPTSYQFSSAQTDATRASLSIGFASARTSIASSAGIAGGFLDPSSAITKQVAEESGSNAIAALLQPPILRTGLLPHASAPGAPRPPSSRDIPPVTLTNVPHVDTKLFKSYVGQAGPLYEAFRSAKEECDEQRPSSSHRKSRTNSRTSIPLIHGMQRRTSGGLSSAKSEPGSPIEASSDAQQYKRRNSGGGSGRRTGLTVAPLSTIPNVYFEQDFRLENPRTFDIVSERSEVVRQPTTNGSASALGTPGKKALAANAILQEKLSWYMDTVEIHLISSISTASTSFFAALGSLRELHAEAAQSVQRIKALRDDLSHLDKEMAQGGLKVVEMKRRIENIRKLADAVRQLQEIVQSLAKCEEHVEIGEVEIALKGLATVERLIAGDSDDVPVAARTQKPLEYSGSLIDLRGMKALDRVRDDVSLLRKRIGKAYEVQFIETLMNDLRRHTDNVPANSTFYRWYRASSRLRGQHVRTPSEMPAYVHVDNEFRSALTAKLKGLARSDSIMPAATAYREVVLKEFKNLIRRHIPSSRDDDVESTTSISTQDSRHVSHQERSSILARNLRNLDPEDAEVMLRKIYSNVGEALRRLGTQVKVLLDITSSLGNPARAIALKSPPRSPFRASIDDELAAEPSPGPPPALVKQEEIQQALDLSSLLGQAVDIAQNQVTKVLKVRSDQTTRMDMAFFLRYFSLNRLFADECEAVSGRSGHALKKVVQDHIKAFLGFMAENEKQKLVREMDADKWEAKDFAEKESGMLASILAASTEDVEQWTKATWIWETTIPSNGVSTPNGKAPELRASQEESRTVPREKVRNAMVGEDKYILPESALAVTRGIEVYERLIGGIPNLTPEITTQLLDYLKQFNSRSSQLILGAGATRSAGLKNITTKHLALSSQSLSYVIALIPYLREFVRRQLPSAGAQMIEFDKIKRLLQEHQSGIHDKFVEIMTGRAAAHASAMRQIDWDKGTGTSVNGYMESLIKETALLHKVLSRHLPIVFVKTIIVPIISNYKEQLGRAFGQVEVKTQAGKERLLRDVEFFKTRISKIEEAGDIGEHIFNIVNDKSVASPTEPPPKSATLEKPPSQAESPSLTAAQKEQKAG